MTLDDFNLLSRQYLIILITTVKTKSDSVFSDKVFLAQS